MEPKPINNDITKKTGIDTYQLLPNLSEHSDYDIVNKAIMDIF